MVLDAQAQCARQGETTSKRLLATFVNSFQVSLQLAGYRTAEQVQYELRLRGHV